ncbi:secreted RxLR effector protein 161-like [Nicotiana tomentosiformis]|uniref:secreted RxLR effector protein 161-like n=1 Tax=Nicotiana tomentosiformis TaxID=4098 RepID=UPI00388C97D0
MSNAKSIGTPMSPSTRLDRDEHGKSVDKTKYHGMIGSLLYLRASRPDIVFSVYVDLVGDKEDRKSTSGTCQLLGKALVSWNSKKHGLVALSTTEVEYIAIGQCCAQLL